MTKLEKLVDIASAPLLNSPPLSWICKDTRTLYRELGEILTKKNGFFVFESALRFFPSGNSPEAVISLEEWNSGDLWRKNYSNLIDPECFFFAEDVFGCQFCIKGKNLYTFDPETAQLTLVAKSLENLCQKILKDYNFYTGHSLAHAWQAHHKKRLPLDMRLMPKTPFMCGGEYNLDNLVAVNAVESMKIRGDIANQLKDVPSGTKIKFKFIN